MKLHADIGWVLVGLLAGVVLFAAVLFARLLLKPEAVTWVATETPVATATKLEVNAVARRQFSSNCSNGPQMELLTRGQVTRLPVPTRSLVGDRATYSTVLLRPFDPGVYRVRVVEVVNCGGTPQVIPSPWLSFEVK